MTCTCETEHIRHCTIGYPLVADGGWPILRTVRRTDEDCPQHGNKRPVLFDIPTPLPWRPTAPHRKLQDAIRRALRR